MYSSEWLRQTPLLPLENPLELAGFWGNRLWRHRLHTDPARGTGFDRKAIPLEKRERFFTEVAPRPDTLVTYRFRIGMVLTAGGAGMVSR